MNLERVERENLDALVAGIAKQAAYDWRSSMAILQREPECGQADRTRIECENFFLSDYFHGLTGLDGERVLNRLKKEFDRVR